MKHKGCSLEFTEKRNSEVMAAYRRIIAGTSYINIKEVSQLIVDSPCSRFWVSEERATDIVSALLRGQPILDNMRPAKREMYQEIYSRVMELRQYRLGVPLFDIVMEVVNSPAPKFYMHPRFAMDIVYHVKRMNNRRHHGKG